jgi:YqaJ-like viral recombinase domain
MTLTIFKELEQGSDAWLQARCGIITASQIGKLITPTLKVADNDTSRGVIETLVAERLTGLVEYVHPSFEMQRGSMDEPLVRDLYVENFAPVDEVGFMVREFDGFKIGFSPDGMVHNDGLIEIKSRKPKIQLATILADVVPRENMAQLQTGLLVSGRDWIEYLSYSGGMPLYRKRVLPDLLWFDAILAAAEKFEKTAGEMAERYAEATRGLPTTERVDHFADIEIAL